MLFKEVIGQSQAKIQMIESVRQNRLSHAQLLVGPQGNGALALAIAYAQYVMCTNRGEDDACGVCASCRKISNLAHPDLHFVFPVASTAKIKAKPVSDNFIAEWREQIKQTPYFTLNSWLENIGVDNKQGIIGSDESVEIIRKLNFKSYESEYKVMVIWLPEKMNDSSANKLLKMIEEPPMKTIFLLVAENTSQILTTIISRTQLVKVPKIETSHLYEHLMTTFAMPSEKALSIARISAGNFIKAKELIQGSAETELFFENFTQWMRFCYSAKVIETIEIIDKLCKLSREMLKNFLNYSSMMVRENLIMNLTAGQNENLNYLSPQEESFSKKFNPFIHAGNTEKILQEIELAYKHLTRNGSDRLIMIDLSLKLMQLLRT